MIIRSAKTEDLDTITKLYAYAREQMKNSGNFRQWGDNKPDPHTIREDISKSQLYLICDQNEICGVFAFFIGADPTYQIIEDGAWLNDKTYGVIHRVASNGKTKGIVQQALRFCEDKIKNIRIDTHEDNKIMQHILEKEGFQKCGRIYVADGSPRIAYQKTTV